jgi:D-glycero-D-manno-heptose 1,7-bisphosphate phosphatase
LVDLQSLALAALLCDALTVHPPPQRLRDTVRFVFLDRDGVINRKMPEGRYVTSPEDFILCPGAASAVSKLNQAGVKLIVVTNQRGIALGLYSEAQLADIHRHMQDLLSVEDAHINAIYYCPHARDVCQCRKPGPGMFLQTFQDFPEAVPLNSIVIGDSLSDIEAGNNLGMLTVFIDGDPSTQRRGASQARAMASYEAPSLLRFVEAHFV